MVVQHGLALLHLMTAVHSFDTGTLVTSSPAEGKKCFTCSVFTFIDNRLLCTNPGTCYGIYCYSYMLSDLRSMFLSGCAEDWSDFPFRKGVDDRLLCHAGGHFGLCLCKAGNDLCNKRYSNDTELQWMNSNGIILNSISHKVTGFTADYARNRVLQMRAHDYPETFPGTPLNSAQYILRAMVFLVSSIVIE
ncbi:hypothetical protein Angca_001577, partial [Angiostrongylus cantonensis]